MRKGLRSSIIIIGLFTAISVTGAHADLLNPMAHKMAQTRGNHAAGPSWDSRTYRGAGKWRKVFIPKNDTKAIQDAMANGAAIVADYQSFELLMMEDRAVEALDSRNSSALKRAATPITVRDDFNILFLRAGPIDTTADNAPGTLFTEGGADRAPLSPVNLKNFPIEGGLTLVQFVGPVKRVWLEQLKAAGFEVIAYVPNNGYLVRGNVAASTKLAALATTPDTSGGGFIQWVGPLADSYKIDPAIAANVKGAARSSVTPITVAVQFVRGSMASEAEADLRTVKKMAVSVIGEAYNVLNFTDLRISINPSQIGDLANLPTVVNIERWSPPRLLDEEADQIDAAQLNADGTQPKGPGY
ncbi:MAG TPA: hypothetical protein VJX67_20845, partial [Blastocatellia bacterium]|nr:hypothetical protein [Blastocatellia bacterium]